MHVPVRTEGLLHVLTLQADRYQNCWGQDACSAWWLCLWSPVWTHAEVVVPKLVR
jgi:hypothetical protein